MAPDTRDFRNPIIETAGAPPAAPAPATTPTPLVEDRTGGFASSSSVLYAACGLATIVLAVIGLIGYWYAYAENLAGIASIVLGVGLAIESWLIGVRPGRVFTTTIRGVEDVAGGEGTGAEFAGGVVGVVLGIMALLNWSPLTLIAVATIVLGAAMVLGGGSAARLHALVTRSFGAEPTVRRPFAQEVITAAASGQMFVGVAAVVLGIIGVVLMDTWPLVSLVLSLVAYLCLGCAALFTGATMCSRLAHLSRR